MNIQAHHPEGFNLRTSAPWDAVPNNYATTAAQDNNFLWEQYLTSVTASFCCKFVSELTQVSCNNEYAILFDLIVRD